MRRRLIIVCSILILAVVIVVVRRELLVRKIGANVVRNYQLIIDKYVDAINGKDGQWQCPAMTAEEILSFSRLCDERHCHISARAAGGLGGQSIGPRIKIWSGTGMIESIFLQNAYALGYVVFADGSQRPSVKYVRRFSKDGHDIKLTLIAWPDDVEAFAGPGPQKDL